MLHTHRCTAIRIRRLRPPFHNTDTISLDLPLLHIHRGTDIRFRKTAVGAAVVGRDDLADGREAAARVVALYVLAQVRLRLFHGVQKDCAESVRMSM